MSGVGARRRTQPEDDTVTAVQLPRFNGVEIGGTVGALIWRGGLQLSSPVRRFRRPVGSRLHQRRPGISRLVTDRGNFVTGQLIYDERTARSAWSASTVEPIQNSKGAPCPGSTPATPRPWP